MPSRAKGGGKVQETVLFGGEAYAKGTEKGKRICLVKRKKKKQKSGERTRTLKNNPRGRLGDQQKSPDSLMWGGVGSDGLWSLKKVCPH